MKQKDIVLIIVIAFVSGVLSLILSKVVFGSPQNRQQTVEVVEPITDEFPTPDTKYFNPQSINPTLPIQIGENNNPSPFNGQQ